MSSGVAIKRKSKGGAEKGRVKMQKMLQEDAKKIPALTSYFKSAGSGVIAEPMLPQAPDADSSKVPVIDLPHSIDLIEGETDGDITITNTNETTSENNTNESYNLFKKPMPKDLPYFFKYHPIQPVNIGRVKNAQQLFRRKDGANRMWLTYSQEIKALFCSVCLAYGANTVFTTGLYDLDVKHVYERVSEHEASRVHMSSVDAHLMRNTSKDIYSLLNSTHKSSHNLRVEKYRQVLDREIEILKLIGRRGLSYRGKRNESSSLLHLDGVDRGNFLELVLLVAKYDEVLKDHIDSFQKKSECQGRGSHLTFLSKTIVNNLVKIMTELIQERIASEIKECGGMFSVLLDTTQDIAIEDQCSVIVRYAHHTVQERMIALTACKSTTGEALYKTVKMALKTADIHSSSIIGSCTDGASNMQGPYNGFVAHLSNESPNQVLVWCYSHVLNLVMVDATRNIEAANLFSLLNMCAVFLRESHNRMDVWKEETNDSRRLGLVGSTRWWSKGDALSKVFGVFNDSANALYVKVVRTLIKLEDSLTGEPQLKATALKQKLLSYDVILSAHIFLRIFQFTTPLSKYLQTKGLDVLQAYKMVQSTLTSLEAISRDFESVECSANKFVQWANEELVNEELEVEQQLKEIRTRCKKKRDDEKCADDVSKCAIDRFKVNVHNQVLDIVTEKMRSRFEKHGALFSDLACLDPRGFNALDVAKLPQCTFTCLATKLAGFDSNITASSIRLELMDFASKWESLRKNVPDNLTIANDDVNDEEHEDEVGEERDPSTSQHSSTCKNCPLCCFTILKRYNLFSDAYYHLFLCYQYLLTIPATQVSCERSFSKLKYIKSRLRSTLSQDHLESFMLMAMEADILANIPNGVIIDRLASTSTLLHRVLTHI